VDEDDRLAGVITQTDLVRTLAVAVQGRAEDGMAPPPRAPRAQASPAAQARP